MFGTAIGIEVEDINGALLGWADGWIGISREEMCKELDALMTL